MQRYRRGRRPVAIVIGILLVAGVPFVLTSRPGSGPAMASVIVSGLALVSVAVRMLMRAHPARDCGAVMASAAAFAVVASSLTGLALVVSIALVVVLVGLATVLLFISAEAAAHEAKPRFRR